MALRFLLVREWRLRSQIKEETRATMRCIPLEQEARAASVFTATSPPRRARFSLGLLGLFPFGNMSGANFSTLVRANANLVSQ